ncbi:hypothetical protein FNU76_15735 [Chitinimonas arctica]|uniref:Uncharacterized protein n=1 Tax=Chitinimonas arctica TaxID=2594795 RepID=A0A516SHR0_9NEIS|nr:hypothetical protein [Chitinimonas arctica]QDQ27683.1 hypothetical protein FNU76_15735 [Chitinimonas arctica]
MEVIEIEGNMDQFVAGNVIHENGTVRNAVHLNTERSAGPQVVLDEQNFNKLTKMKTSAPARFALLRLMEHDVTCQDLAQVWGQELVFQQSQFRLTLSRWAPWWVGGLATIWGTLVGACIFGAFLSEPAYRVFWVASIFAISVVMFWRMAATAVPYFISRRLRTIIPRVNRDLPEALAEWRNALRKGPNSTM